MKDIRIPILFAAAAIVFSMVSLLSCQSEKVASAEEMPVKTEIVQETAKNDQAEKQVNTEIAEARSVNMRFGPR